jgi:hypothetical protein
MRKRWRARHLWCCGVGIVAIAACRSDDVELGISERVAEGGRSVLRLTVGPAATTPRGAIPLTARSSKLDSLLASIDASLITELRGDTVAVLDRVARVITVATNSGVVRRLHDNDPTDPLAHAIAMASVDSTIAVLTADATTPIRLYSTSGSALRAGGWKLAGDVGHATHSGPPIPDGNTLVPPEDLSQRLKATRDRYVLFSQTYDTTSFGDRPDRRVARWLRLDPSVDEADPIDSTTPVSRRPPTGMARPGPEGRFDEPFLARRSVWATSLKQIAVHHEPGQLSVRDGSGTVTADLRWKPSTRPLKESDRLAVARWYEDAALRSESNPSRKIASPQRVRNALYRKFVSMMPFDTLSSDIAGLFLYGDCLWIAPWRPRDGLRAIVRDWWIVDLHKGTVAAHVMVPDSVVSLTFVGRSIYGKRVEEGGHHRVIRYEWPFVDCQPMP